MYKIQELKEGPCEVELWLRSGEKCHIKGRVIDKGKGKYLIGRKVIQVVDDIKYQRKFSFGPGTRIRTFFI